ncbi:lasso peptide biosynthesis B2 protein [Saccharopolyspora sp. CA-218241]|uniref:lasso peptide biosynthesis B2 protein n=1 Tax=Saccharopolyspora sp. CA-218241 TaxID=3240027 RepID=UPI003D9984E2
MLGGPGPGAGELARRRSGRCLRRSMTVALLYRVRGCWPTWHVGVRRIPPLADSARRSTSGCAIAAAESSCARTSLRPRPRSRSAKHPRSSRISALRSSRK